MGTLEGPREEEAGPKLGLELLGEQDTPSTLSGAATDVTLRNASVPPEMHAQLRRVDGDKH